MGNNSERQMAATSPTPPRAISTLFDSWSALLILFAAWIVQFCTVGPVVSFSVYQAFYTSTWMRGVSPSTISWIGSTQIFLEFAIALVGGVLLDRGYLRHLLVSGSIIFTGSAFALAFTTRDSFYQVFLSQGIGMGIGLGLVYMPSIVMIPRYFTGRPMLAMGVVSTGGSAGGLIFPIILERYFTSELRFKDGALTCAWVILGCLVLSTAILLIFSGHEYPAQTSKETTTEPHSSSISDLEKVPSLTEETPSHSLAFMSMGHGTIAFALAIAGCFLASTACYWPIFYISLFGESNGISSSKAAYAVSALNIASIAGRTVPCWIADRIGVFRVIVPSVILAGVSSLTMLVCKDFASLIAFAVIYGILSGAYVALFFPMVDTLTSRWPEKKGLLNGVACMPVSVALLIGSPATGAIVGAGPNYRWAQGAGFCGAGLLAGAILILAAAYVKRLEMKQNST